MTTELSAQNSVPFVVGLNHETASIEIRERLVVDLTRLPDVLQRFKNETALSELVLLSTCNRTEVYGRGDPDRVAPAAVTRALTAWAAPTVLADRLYVRDKDAAITHLFRVAAGLDSMIKGEHEILGQVKQAYQTAQAGGFTGKLLNVLFQRSLYVGKRVRTETGLSMGSSSVGGVAVAMAQRIFGDLTTRCIMILGAGQMAELTAKHLLAQKVRTLLVANRTLERAQELAAEFGGQALSFEAGMTAMVDADIVICSTAAPHPIIRPEPIKAVMTQRRGRSLFFIDIALPRDVDPAVHTLDNVYVYNLDDLQKIVDDNERLRARAITSAEAIVQHESEAFARWLAAGHAGQARGLRHRPSESS